jgi:peptidoglycan/xylan/chitin deacetylase (PgdA/CDA1 family)
MLKIALTHDVDRTRKTYQYFTRFMKSLSQGNFKEALYHITPQFKKEPYWNVYDIASLEDSYGLRSTFFILDESIRYNPFKPKTFVLAIGRYNMFEPKIKEAILYLDSKGWEIGLHGSFLSYNNKELLGREKLRLESIVGHQVIGTRQHHLNMDETTWRIQEELGFQYDSTWGFNKDIGIKEGRIRPFHPNQSEFTVYPLSVMDICFMGIAEKERWERMQQLMDEIEKNDAILVVNFHHRVYNEREYPGYKAAYARIIETGLKRGATIAPLIHFWNANDKGDTLMK